MRRREFVTLLGAAAIASSRDVLAQRTERVRHIGVLVNLAESDPEGRSRVMAFRRGLDELGWTEGRNLQVEYRWAVGSADRVRALAKELVERQPDLIACETTPGVAAVLQKTRTIPIVFVNVADPVGSGFVASLARPGGKVTGFTNFDIALGTKWLELLKQLAPRVTRVACIFNPDTAPGRGLFFVRPMEAAAPSFAIELTHAPIHNDAEIEAVISALGREPDGGLIVTPDPFIAVHREVILKSAARHRLPAVYPLRYYARSGGLAAYGPDVEDLFRQAAMYVDRILKGADPADLPVQAPIKFELAINVQTAKSLNLTVPVPLLARADEVIE